MLNSSSPNISSGVVGAVSPMRLGVVLWRLSLTSVASQLWVFKTSLVHSNWSCLIIAACGNFSECVWTFYNDCFLVLPAVLASFWDLLKMAAEQQVWFLSGVTVFGKWPDLHALLDLGIKFNLTSCSHDGWACICIGGVCLFVSLVRSPL